MISISTTVICAVCQTHVHMLDAEWIEHDESPSGGWVCNNCLDVDEGESDAEVFDPEGEAAEVDG